MKTKTQPRTLTLEVLKEQSNGDIYADIKFAETFLAPYPDGPKKPFLKRDATSVEAKQYATDLERFESEKMKYGQEKQEYRKVQGYVNSVIEEYIKDLAGFNSLPEKSKAKVWRKAYEDGHSEGYARVYHELVELVDLFN